MAPRAIGVRRTAALHQWCAVNGLGTRQWPQQGWDTEKTFNKLAPRADYDWDIYVHKGREMHCAMNKDLAAIEQDPSFRPAVFTEYADLARHGWVMGKDKDPDQALAQSALEDVFETLNIDAEQNFFVSVQHSIDVTIDKTVYEATDAFYDHLFNINAGLIVADSLASPEYAKKDDRWSPDQFVPLKQWADVAFLLWERAAREGSKDVQNLKHAFHSVISNDDTIAIMQRAVGKTADFKDWGQFGPMQENGRTFKPGSDAYYALLYSPNGRGIGWLLIQHKATLGVKTVSEITVFGEPGEAMLYFKIVPVEV